jgi:hypothetical protein
MHAHGALVDKPLPMLEITTFPRCYSRQIRRP